MAAALDQIAGTPQVDMRMDEMIVGTICGGSDATSGITANPAVGRAFDRLVSEGARVIFEETGELIGCEQIMAGRAARPELAANAYRVRGKGGALLHDTRPRQLCAG
jgi:altronate hydrolase